MVCQCQDEHRWKLAKDKIYILLFSQAIVPMVPIAPIASGYVQCTRWLLVAAAQNASIGGAWASHLVGLSCPVVWNQGVNFTSL